MTRLAAFVVTSVAATMAHAEPPRVDLARCTAFDARALAKAIARELPAETGTSPFAVVVACPDLVTANLHVEPVPADGPIARSLDLGEVPGDLRVKLLALAIAELAEAAVTARLPPSTSGPTKARRDPADPKALTDADPKARPASPQSPPRDPTTPVAPPIANTATRVATIAPSREQANAATRATIAPPRDQPVANAPTRVATIGPPSEQVIVDRETAPPRQPIELGPLAGVRMFASARTAVAELGGELRLPWFRVGLVAGAGRNVDPLGKVYPWLATATLARELVCIDLGCALVRGEAGVAGVVAHAGTEATATDTHAAYAQASLAVEIHHRFAGWTMTAMLGGYARGLVAKAVTREVSSLAGAVATATIGARWR